jgi:hypothetical protein
MEIDLGTPKKCARCKQDFIVGDKIVPYYRNAKGRKSLVFDFANGRTSVDRTQRIFHDGDVIGVSVFFHLRCLPPSLKNRSRSGQPGPASPESLSKESTQDAGPV